MKSLEELFRELLADASELTGVDTFRDQVSLAQRVKHEGDGFLTIALPNLCKYLERGLEEGQLSASIVAGFRALNRRCRLPAFLSGLTSQVFDNDGYLRKYPSSDCIRVIRQICLFGKKIERECTPARMRDAERAYLRCEEEIGDLPDSQFMRYFMKVAEILCEDLFPTLWDQFPEITPDHGPGATVERATGNGKWSALKLWPARFERVGHPFEGLVYPERMHTLSGEQYDRMDGEYEILDPADEQPVKVTFVPKTQKTPRVIAVEPVAHQFLQQGLMRYLVSRIENPTSITSGRVNFTDQGINRGMAFTSSVDRKWSTIDLSEASDRVSCALAEAFFRSVPFLWTQICACRSKRAQLPSGDIITLRKFASMGSALCFPVEALVFFTSIVASRILAQGGYPDRRLVTALSRDVYVYGDDLIVPADETPVVLDDLESLGLKVNRHKTFVKGFFRESCGLDCYGGAEVTPVYLRRDLPESKANVPSLLSTIATANQLFSAGYRRTATVLRSTVERLLGPLPQVRGDTFSSEKVVRGMVTKLSLGTLERSSALGWHWPSEASVNRRYNISYQRFEAKVWSVMPTLEADRLDDGWLALAKCFRTIGSHERVIAWDHLAVSARRYAPRLKRTWVPLTSLV